MTFTSLLETQLETIARSNGTLKALISLTEATARQEARAADAASAEGRWLGPLHGVTVSLKDNIDTAGHETTAGAAFFRGRVPDRDATVVRRLRQAGAVIVGKANLTELAWGTRSSSAVGGQTRNPWNTDRIPGGSSGGSGASVAAGMCTASLGTDTGGSVRLPAALCGVAGLRPTSGSVPNTGTIPVSRAHDTVGPVARRVSDVARLFAVIAGPDPEDPYSSQRTPPNFLPAIHDGIEGRVVGIPRNHYFDRCEDDVAEAVRRAASVLEGQGAKLVDIDVPMVEDAQEMATRIVFSDACSFHGERLRNEPQSFSADIHDRMSRGFGFTGTDYAEAMTFKAAWKRALRTIFRDVDIILSPTAPVGAPPIEDGKSLYDSTRDLVRNTYCGALGNIPGLSVPCGFTREGLPVGLQLEAAWWQEPLLLRAGCAFQRRTDYHLREPRN